MTSADSLKIEQNEDGSFAIEWDKNDPKWSWLNELTPEEIQSMIGAAVRHDRNGKL
jgi:hypothetical protein